MENDLEQWKRWAITISSVGRGKLNINMQISKIWDLKKYRQQMQNFAIKEEKCFNLGIIDVAVMFNPWTTL